MGLLHQGGSFSRHGNHQVGCDDGAVENRANNVWRHGKEGWESVRLEWDNFDKENL